MVEVEGWSRIVIGERKVHGLGCGLASREATSRLLTKPPSLPIGGIGRRGEKRFEKN